MLKILYNDIYLFNKDKRYLSIYLFIYLFILYLIFKENPIKFDWNLMFELVQINFHFCLMNINIKGGGSKEDTSSAQPGRNLKTLYLIYIKIKLIIYI